MNNIGEVIRKYRLKNNLTQEELGTKMFITKQGVSKWENGKTLPDIISIRKLSEILSIPNEEILGETVKQTEHYRKWISILIPAIILSFFMMLFFAFGGFGFIQRRTQNGNAVVVLFENGNVVSTDKYQITGPVDPKPGQNGYSFDIDYGEVKEKIITSNSEEIEFGFVNTNNWHNVIINISINNDSQHKSVSQSVIYKTDDDLIEVINTDAVFDKKNKSSVFRGGV